MKDRDRVMIVIGKRECSRVRNVTSQKVNYDVTDPPRFS